MDSMGFSEFGDSYGGSAVAEANFGPPLATGGGVKSSTGPSLTDYSHLMHAEPSETASDVAGSTADMRDVIADDDDTENGDDVDDGSDDDKLNRRPVELPPHHCRYCTLHDPLAVVRCQGCKKWFCNSTHGTSGSHIVTHLVRAKHNEIALHEESPLGDGPVECFACGSRNIFQLGFIPSREESVVVLLCREPCLHSNTLKDMSWDPEGWQPLIHDRQLLPWLVKKPAGKELERSRHLEARQIRALEEMWRTRDGDLEDLNRVEAREHLNQIPFTFKDGHEFRELFQALIDAECDENRRMKENLQFDNITVAWQKGVGGKNLAVVELPLTDMRLGEGDIVLLLHKESKWEATATVLRIVAGANTNDEVSLELKPTSLPSSSVGFTVKVVFKSTSFDRMRTAMKTMATEETSLSACLYHSLLGHPIHEPTVFRVRTPKELQAPNLAPLNHSQQQAVTSVLRRPLSLIQGPPGTGKTTTSATIVYHMARLNEAQVLVTAPSNVAVDQLAERIAQTGLNVVRVAALSREGIQTSVDHLMLHTQVRRFCQEAPARSDINRLHRLKETVGDLNTADRAKYLKLIREVEGDLISAADVVCCTCSGAGDKRLDKIRFKHVLIDESTQASEPETLIPIVMGAKQVVLVGDHCQLGPTILSRPANDAGLGRSLFERLVYLGFKPHRLEIQYRMHPCLSEFSSNHFYDGTLQNGVSAEERDASSVFPWPNPRKPMFFYNSIGPEEVAGSGTSCLNRAEAALAEKMLTLLLQNGVKPDEVGVVTPYEGQRAFLVNYLQRRGTFSAAVYDRVEVASVDSFQGREKEFIILTCVRSNYNQGIGFLSDWRRLNVALTRARRGVMVIGNARVLSQNQLWYSLLTHFKDAKLIVDGPVTELRPVNVALQRPRHLDLPTGPAPGGSAMLQSLGYASASQTESESSYASSGAAYAQPLLSDVPYAPGVALALQLVGGGGGGAAAGGGGGWAPASQASMSGVSQSQ